MKSCLMLSYSEYNSEQCRVVHPTPKIINFVTSINNSKNSGDELFHCLPTWQNWATSVLAYSPLGAFLCEKS